MLKRLANAKIIALLALIASGVGALVTYQARKWGAEHAKEVEREAAIRAVCGTWTGEYRGIAAGSNECNTLFQYDIRPDGTATISSRTPYLMDEQTGFSGWTYSQGFVYINGDQYTLSGEVMRCVAGRHVAGIDGLIRHAQPLAMTRQGGALGNGSLLGRTPPSGAAAATPSPGAPAQATPQKERKVDMSAVEKLLGD